MKAGIKSGWEAASIERHEAVRYPLNTPPSTGEGYNIDEVSLPRPRGFAMPALALGVVLLVGTFVGTAMILRGSPQSLLPQSNSGTAPPTTGVSNGPRGDQLQEASKRAVCAAFVDVEQGVTPIYPLNPGRVKSIQVKESQRVKEGDILFQLDDTLAKAQLEEAKGYVQAGRQQLELAKMMIPQHEEKLRGQNAAISARKSELAAAEAKLRPVKKQLESGLISQDDYTIGEKGVEALKESIKIEEAKLRGLEQHNSNSPMLLASAELLIREAQLQKAQFAYNECFIKAPFDGEILRLFISPGETLGPNPRTPALTICPDKAKIVRAEVEQEFERSLKLGQTALIQDDTALSQDTWKGKVVKIANNYTPRKSRQMDPGVMNDIRTKDCIIEVEPNDQLRPLVIGQKMRVTLLP